jgi:hypothetical protein
LGRDTFDYVRFGQGVDILPRASTKASARATEPRTRARESRATPAAGRGSRIADRTGARMAPVQTIAVRPERAQLPAGEDARFSKEQRASRSASRAGRCFNIVEVGSAVHLKPIAGERCFHRGAGVSTCAPARRPERASGGRTGDHRIQPRRALSFECPYPITRSLLAIAMRETEQWLARHQHPVRVVGRAVLKPCCP